MSTFFIDKGVRQQHRKRRTHCKQGHELTGWNRMENNKGRCRTCHNATETERKRRKRKEGAAAAAYGAERVAYNTRGLCSFIARRRARGVPEGGWQVAE